VFWDILFGEDILMEVCGSGILEKVGVLENWKIMWLWRKERNKGKGKEIIMRRYFLGRGIENNRCGGFPGFSHGCGNLSGKYRNRPKFKYLGTTRKNYQKSRILY